MSDVKFACPLCEQHIQCDARLAGQQIKCPGCQGDILIPAPEPRAAAPAPLPQPAVRVSLAPAAAPRSVPAPVPAARVSAGAKPPVASIPDEAGQGKRGLKIAAMAVVGIAVAALVFKVTVSMQKKFNAEQARIAKESDGGELGHIANLYQTLDATDPNKMGRFADEGAAKDPGKYRALAAAAALKTRSAEDLPVVKPTWTLELAEAKIPETRANGSVAGTDVVADGVRLDAFTAVSYALTLRPGASLTAEREVTIFLRLKAGEKIEGRTWAVAKDMTADVPQVVKRWKTDARAAPQQKSFKGGYVLKLELGKATDGLLPGKVYVALPDEEQTVMAGAFSAVIRVPSAAAGPGSTRPANQSDGDWGE